MTRADVLAQLAKLSTADVREHGLAAIRRQRDKAPSRLPVFVSYTEWLQVFFREWAGPHAEGRELVNAIWNVTFDEATTPSGLVPAPAFWQWMEHAAFAVRVPDPSRANTPAWAITELGMRRLDSEHPCRPGAMERLRADFLTDHEDSLNRLEDALACFESALYRPAVVMLGLAYERLIVVVLGRLGKPAKGQPGDRQDALKKAIEHQPGTEARRAALCALSVADSIRTARNAAAHTAAGEWDATEVHELLADGIRSYAKLAGYTP